MYLENEFGWLGILIKGSTSAESKVVISLGFWSSDQQVTALLWSPHEELPFRAPVGDLPFFFFSGDFLLPIFHSTQQLSLLLIHKDVFSQSWLTVESEKLHWILTSPCSCWKQNYPASFLSQRLCFDLDSFLCLSVIYSALSKLLFSPSNYVMSLKAETRQQSTLFTQGILDLKIYYSSLHNIKTN